MAESHDVIVIGGGACGATVALFLLREGLSVALFDQGRAGREASWASAGIIGPRSSATCDPWFLEATTLSRRLYDELIPELQQQTGIAVGYGGEGGLLFGRTREEHRMLEDAARLQLAASVPTTLLDTAAARNREAALPENVTGAVWWPEDRFLDARAYTEATVRAVVMSGGMLYEGIGITGLEWQGSKIIGVRSGGERWLADTVINAAGAWAGNVDPRLSHPVYPFHGQIMAVSTPPCGLRHNLSRPGIEGYVTPRTDGRVIFGATHEMNGYKKCITPAGIRFLGVLVDELLPDAREMEVLDMWSGLRPGSHDNLPTVGPDPRVTSGYLWAAGHSAWGMQQIPATASVVTELVLRRTLSLSTHQLGVERHLDLP